MWVKQEGQEGLDKGGGGVRHIPLPSPCLPPWRGARKFPPPSKFSPLSPSQQTLLPPPVRPFPPLIPLPLALSTLFPDKPFSTVQEILRSGTETTGHPLYANGTHSFCLSPCHPVNGNNICLTFSVESFSFIFS